MDFSKLVTRIPTSPSQRSCMILEGAARPKNVSPALDYSRSHASSTRAYAWISSGLKKSGISRFALSSESDPWMLFRPIVSARSPRIVPGSASAVGARASSSSSSGFSRLRPVTLAQCPSSQALKTRRPSWESFQAANSAFSTWVTGFAPCFFLAQPRIDVRKAGLSTKDVKNFSTSPRGRSGPSRLSIRSARSAGMSLPFGVSIVASPGAASAGAGTSSETIASSAAAPPGARRNACVHGVQRGTRPRWSRFDWHLWEQNRKTVPSFRMNILPVPGSISLPQKEQERRAGIGSPDRELAGLAGGLAEHQHIADLDAPLHVPRDDAALVPSVEDADLHLDRLARHPRPADDLDHFCGDAVLVRHRLSVLLPGSVTSSSRGACRTDRRAPASPCRGPRSRSRPSPCRGRLRRRAPVCSGRTRRARLSPRTGGACGRGSPRAGRPPP